LDVVIQLTTFHEAKQMSTITDTSSACRNASQHHKILYLTLLSCCSIFAVGYVTFAWFLN